jgi:hypothetical protein
MFKAFLLSVKLKAFISTGLTLNDQTYACIVSLRNNLHTFDYISHVGEEVARQFTVQSATQYRHQVWFGGHKPVLLPQIKFSIFKNTLRLKSQST